MLKKIWQWILGLFKKRAKEIIPELKDMPKVLAQEAIKKKKFRWVTHTAINCLSCGSPFVRHWHNTQGIMYTCSDICRKLLRGGHRNIRILTKVFNKSQKEAGWTTKQMALFKAKLASSTD